MIKKVAMGLVAGIAFAYLVGLIILIPYILIRCSE